MERNPPPEPGEGQLLVEMLVASVNPADLNVIEGRYGELPSLPAVIGNEGVGRVIELGPEAKGYSVGDIVLPMCRGTWAQLLVTDAAKAIRLRPEIDLHQAAMLSINPPSAWGMLEDFVTLREGDWVVQNAANSAVGRSVIQIARSRGIKTLNVVRRLELVGELKALGADAVVLDDADLRIEVEKTCGSNRPRLGLNAVGGTSALNVANALEDGGTLVTYGAMGRQPLKIPNGLLIFRGINFCGYWLKAWRDKAPHYRKEEVVGALAALSVEGKLKMAVHRVFPLSEVVAAVEEAGRESRSGKVLLDLRGE